MSLREQLLAAGLVTKKQVDDAEKSRSQKQFKDKKSVGKAPQPKVLTPAEKAALAKAERDKELNRKKEEKAARRARAIAINQLVEQNRIPRVEDENPDFYNFVEGGKVHRIAVKGDTVEKIFRGELLVARYRGFFALVSKEGAEKIRAIDPKAVLDTKDDARDDTKTQDESDPYKDFVVPDDLKW